MGARERAGYEVWECKASLDGCVCVFRGGGPGGVHWVVEEGVGEGWFGGTGTRLGSGAGALVGVCGWGVGLVHW